MSQHLRQPADGFADPASPQENGAGPGPAPHERPANGDRPPAPGATPRHVAIVMDGNGRWAERRRLPRLRGHRAGVAAARECARACAEAGVECLTLFAFSSENWRRPADEVEHLMDLFARVMDRELEGFEADRVRVRFIGDRDALSPRLRKKMGEVERRTAANRGFTLVLAVNYGGRWDIVNAVRRLARAVERGELGSAEIDRTALEDGLALAGLPPPDLFIRTGGDQRLSNFLLWDLAYTELYFVDTLWPEFGRDALLEALRAFGARERRFGRTGGQLAPSASAAAGVR